ncbi:MAG TPA: hypothetical protein VF472_14540 [Burkholderiaceae bacterium]
MTIMIASLIWWIFFDFTEECDGTREFVLSARQQKTAPKRGFGNLQCSMRQVGAERSEAQRCKVEPTRVLIRAADVGLHFAQHQPTIFLVLRLVDELVFGDPRHVRTLKKLCLRTAFSPHAACAYKRMPYDADWLQE